VITKTHTLPQHTPPNLHSRNPSTIIKMQIAHIALRGFQFLMTLLITALIGNAIAEAFAGNPASINFAIFVAVFSWLVLLFGAVAAFISSLAIPVVLIALDGIATLLTFIAGVVLAARLGVHSCNNRVSFCSAHFNDMVY
jgi:hypothetical protein